MIKYYAGGLGWGTPLLARIEFATHPKNKSLVRIVAVQEIFWKTEDVDKHLPLEGQHITLSDFNASAFDAFEQAQDHLLEVFHQDMIHLFKAENLLRSRIARVAALDPAVSKLPNSTFTAP